MTSPIGQTLDVLDTPQLLIDLDIVDGNLRRMFEAGRQRGVEVRVHFKSLKCAGLARYIAAAGGRSFLCAKLCEAEILADAGLEDIYVANEIVGAVKLRRLAELARRVRLRVCVDDPRNVDEMSAAAVAAGVHVEVLVEINMGMNRCGVEPGAPALELARHIQARPGLRFVGLQGYDGHLQMLADPVERAAKCLAGLAQLHDTRRLIEAAGIPVAVVTGAGTGTWEFTAGHAGITEIQPGSFVLMDCAYHKLRPEFGCALSILTSVISKAPGRYVLDAGSKAISQDFGMPSLKGRPNERIVKLAEEHTRVESAEPNVRGGERREVIPSHGCATMNLHRRCFGVRRGRIETDWVIEASGRYD